MRAFNLKFKNNSELIILPLIKMNEKKPFVLKEAGLTVYEKYLENAKSTIFELNFIFYLFFFKKKIASNDSNNPRDFYISNIE